MSENYFSFNILFFLELKTLIGSKENERINPLEALTPRKFSDFRRRFLKANDGESSPSDSSIKTVSTQENSIQKQNESLQQELTLVWDLFLSVFMH